MGPASNCLADGALTIACVDASAASGGIGSSSSRGQLELDCEAEPDGCALGPAGCHVTGPGVTAREARGGGRMPTPAPSALWLDGTVKDAPWCVPDAIGKADKKDRLGRGTVSGSSCSTAESGVAVGMPGALCGAPSPAAAFARTGIHPGSVAIDDTEDPPGCEGAASRQLCEEGDLSPDGEYSSLRCPQPGDPWPSSDGSAAIPGVGSRSGGTSICPPGGATRDSGALSYSSPPPCLDSEVKRTLGCKSVSELQASGTLRWLVNTLSNVAAKLQGRALTSASAGGCTC
mmetsp:Transcript_50284/g.145802  ORF Transcript_50284/g.145802 Transcript_50284/m.145802 type:complete len:289 (+) Transcript_50284:507-1373(+)